MYYSLCYEHSCDERIYKKREEIISPRRITSFGQFLFYRRVEPFFDSVSTRLKAEAILSTKNCAEIRAAEALQRAANKTISQHGKVWLISRAGISTRIYRAENWIIT